MVASLWRGCRLRVVENCAEATSHKPLNILEVNNCGFEGVWPSPNILSGAKIALHFQISELTKKYDGSLIVLVDRFYSSTVLYPYSPFEFASSKYPCKLRHQPKSV